MDRLITYLLMASLTGLLAALLAGLFASPAFPTGEPHSDVSAAVAPQTNVPQAHAPASAAIALHQARALHASGEAIFLDCRSADEFKAGHVPGAVNIPRGMLEFRHEHALPSIAVTVVVYSNTDRRSLLAAERLVRLGYARAAHLHGGLAGWQAAEHPLETGE